MDMRKNYSYSHIRRQISKRKLNRRLFAWILHVYIGDTQGQIMKRNSFEFKVNIFFFKLKQRKEHKLNDGGKNGQGKAG